MYICICVLPDSYSENVENAIPAESYNNDIMLSVRVRVLFLFAML